MNTLDKIRSIVAADGELEELIDEMFKNFEELMPVEMLPPGFFSKMRKHLDIDNLISRAVPMYLEVFTDEEIDVLYEMHNHPLMPAIRKKLPLVTANISAIAEKQMRGLIESEFEHLEGEEWKSPPDTNS